MINFQLSISVLSRTLSVTALIILPANRVYCKSNMHAKCWPINKRRSAMKMGTESQYVRCGYHNSLLNQEDSFKLLI